jgi:hypothetical protein
VADWAATICEEKSTLPGSDHLGKKTWNVTELEGDTRKESRRSVINEEVGKRGCLARLCSVEHQRISGKKINRGLALHSQSTWQMPSANAINAASTGCHVQHQPQSSNLSPSKTEKLKQGLKQLVTWWMRRETAYVGRECVSNAFISTVDIGVERRGGKVVWG